MLSYLAWAAILHGIGLGLVFVFRKKDRDNANAFLGFFLLALMLEAVSMFVDIDTIRGYPLSYFSIPEVNLLFPLFYWEYISRKLGSRSKRRVLFNTVYVVAFSFMALSIVKLILWNATGSLFIDYFPASVIEEVYFVQLYGGFALASYIAAVSFKEIKSYERYIQRSHADLSATDLRWLKQLNAVVTGVVILWGVELGRIAFGGFGTSEIAELTWLVLFVFMYYASYKALVKMDLVRPDESSDTIRMQGIDSTVEKNKREQLQSTLQTLDALMKDDKIYYQSDLCLADVAKATRIPSRRISESLNQIRGQNFSEYVNLHRVEEAIKLLQNKDHSHLSIEGIGQTVGFKSRSAMYLAFSKVKGHSPGRYKN